MSIRLGIEGFLKCIIKHRTIRRFSRSTIRFISQTWLPIYWSFIIIIIIYFMNKEGLHWQPKRLHIKVRYPTSKRQK